MSDLTLRQNLSPAEFALNIALIGTVPPPEALSVAGDVFWTPANNPTAEPQYLGTQTAGGFLRTLNPLPNQAIRLFVVSKTEDNRASVNLMRNAQTKTFQPNLEDLTPVIFESQAATNTKIFIRVQNYSIDSRFREIQWSLSSDFSNPAILEQGVYNEPGQMLDPDVVILRDTNLSNAETRYVRVRHSSNGVSWTNWSNTITTSYPNSSGTGGSTGEPPPPTGGTGGTKPGCFSGDTYVFLESPTTAIEEIRFADLYRRQLTGRKVLCSDDDGNPTTGEIINLLRCVKNEWLYIEFSDGERLEVTHGHKFYTSLGYIPIRSLAEGAAVLNRDGSEAQITFKQERRGTKEFFNMTVDEYFNYAAGRTRKRVHNIKEILS